MVMLNDLKPNEVARIVSIDGKNIKKQLVYHGISEGSFIRLISRFGIITIEINKKILSFRKDIARHIRVIRVFGTYIILKSI
jgi:Fe2+ transport system protein FeoA